jgi:hypothetical protein
MHSHSKDLITTGKKCNVNEAETKRNHSKERERYAVLLEEESEDQRHQNSPEHTPEPPAIYIPPLIQLLEQVARGQYEG